MIDLTYPALLEPLAPFLAPKRNESASFLIWYLNNYYRLDEVDAVDSVCDQMGDKGVDGIYVNEGAGTIDVFQSKISQKAKSTIGDTQLKEFAGTLTQFSSKANLQKLYDSAGDTQLARLIRRLGLIELLGSYEVHGVFVTNSTLDGNGEAFLQHSPNIRFIGGKELTKLYVSDQKDTLKIGKAMFDVSGFSVASYAVDKDAKAFIAPVSAKELLKLNGIDDQSLFSLNVRASLGNTQVNRDIVSSIKTPALHKKFPLFHNGITILAQKVDSDENKIIVENYFVVNGCQSLNALYQNQDQVTDNLRLLTKFIQVEAGSELSEIITSYSNNQNGVKPRDFKSNHPIQTRLQNEFKSLYKNEYAFEVKRGEPIKGAEVISNENAGLYLVAFDLREPWTTHRKYQVFEEKYADVFGRPEVTADRILLCHILMKEIEAKLSQELENELFGKYALTRYLMLYAIRRALDSDELGKELLSNPGKFVRDSKSRVKLQNTLSELLDSLVIDLNVETSDLGEDFDYRGKLRDKDYVTQLSNDLIAGYQKEVKRKKATPLSERWKQANK
ncbi:MAG: AIPR family protein [Sulfuricaulis sp.]|nr:AIPR family protein [Sulfuricaulis sp.]